MGIRDLPIIAIAGQSNADGRADIVGTDTWPKLNYHTAYSPVNFMEKHEDSVTDPLSWDLDRGPISLQARGGVISGLKGTIGIEMALSRRLNETYGFRHGISKMCIGASGLETHWLPTASYPTGVPNLFSQWMTELHNAMSQMNGHIRAVLWLQGETDANNNTQANNYQTNLTTLINTMRTYFPGCPWLFNRLSSQASSVPFRSTIRTAQTNVAEGLTKCHMIDCDDQPITGQHFTGTGYYGLGNRFADALSTNSYLF